MFLGEESRKTNIKRGNYIKRELGQIADLREGEELVKKSRRIECYFWGVLIPQCTLWFSFTDFEFEKSKCSNSTSSWRLHVYWRTCFSHVLFFELFKIPWNYLAETSFLAGSQFCKTAELLDPSSMHLSLKRWSMHVLVYFTWFSIAFLSFSKFHKTA